MMKRVMKRLLYFFSGLMLLIFMAYYTIKTFQIPQLNEYILSLENYSAFWYVHYTIIGLIFLMSLIFLILAFRPSHSRRSLLWQTHSGDLEISKKSIESYIVKSISQFDHVRLNNIKTTLKSKGNRKSIESNIDVIWLPNHNSTESSLEDIGKYVKSKLEQFTNANVDGIKIKVIDQKKTDKRVI
jgi:hypothetical protein